MALVDVDRGVPHRDRAHLPVDGGGEIRRELDSDHVQDVVRSGSRLDDVAIHPETGPVRASSGTARVRGNRAGHHHWCVRNGSGDRRMIGLILLLAVQIPDAAWAHRGDMIRSARQTFGPEAPTATLAAQIHQESRWRADAKSWVGAQGLAQFMPTTAEYMADIFPGECA